MAAMTLDATPAQLNAWFEVLHRISRLSSSAQTPKPVRSDIAECIELGWVESRDIPAARAGAGAEQMVGLSLTSEGKNAYQLMCQELEHQGNPVLGQGAEPSESWLNPNPFDFDDDVPPRGSKV